MLAPGERSVSARVTPACACTGDHLYRMDYMDFVQKHADTGVRPLLACCLFFTS